MKVKQKEPCGSVFEDNKCELKTGHAFKHRDRGVSWTDAGAARVAKEVRVMPAMDAGIADHVWEIEEIVALVKEEQPGPRGPYKKKEK